MYYKTQLGKICGDIMSFKTKPKDEGFDPARAIAWNEKNVTIDQAQKLIDYAVRINLINRDEAVDMRKGLESNKKSEQSNAAQQFAYLTKSVQTQLGIKEDGAFGTQTMGSIKKQHTKQVLTAVVSIPKERERRHVEKYELEHVTSKISEEAKQLQTKAKDAAAVRKTLTPEQKTGYTTNCTFKMQVDLGVGGPVLIEGRGAYPYHELTAVVSSELTLTSVDKRNLTFILRALQNGTAEITGRMGKNEPKLTDKDVILALKTALQDPDAGFVASLRGTIVKE